MHAKVEESLWHWLYATEGSVPYMYADKKGLVTVGIGMMIEPIESHVGRFIGQFIDMAGNKPDRNAIIAEFNRVKELGRTTLKGADHGAYKAGAKMLLSQNFIRTSAISMFRAKAASFKDKGLWWSQYFGDFDDFPADAQMCLVSTAYGGMYDKEQQDHAFNVACKERRWLDASKMGRWRHWVTEKRTGHILMMENAQVAQDTGDNNPEPAFPGKLKADSYEIDDQIKPYGQNLWTAGDS